MAGLLVLGLIMLFGMPSTAHAHGAGHHHPGVAAADPAASDAAQPATAGRGGQAVVTAATGPAPSADDGDCGRRGGSATGMGCCVGGACPMMHSGVPPAGLLPLPPPDGPPLLLQPAVLSKGIGTLPAFRPPRASA